MKIDVGSRQYEVVEGWGALPEGFKWGLAAAVACDSEDNVHVFARTEHPHMIFDKSGNFLETWGSQIFGSPHGICITPNNDTYLVDTVTHLVTKWDALGRHCMSLGLHHKPADTGWSEEKRDEKGFPLTNGVAYGGGPFHQPTDVSIADNGDIFVSDGYRNSRVHKFSSDGTLLMSWGEPGHAQEYRNTKEGPGKFHTPHGIWTHKGLVYVSDRENNRIQVYTTEGEFVEIWTGFERPTKIYIDADEVMYVSELEDRFSILNLDGSFIGSYKTERSNDVGKFWGPHCIWTDTEGSIYISEVLGGMRVQKFARVK